jgi:hypothetical protein
MGIIKLIAAPIRSILRFPLFQLAVVFVIVLALQAADDNSAFGKIYNGLDRLVDFTIQLCAQLFEIKSFTRSGLTVSLMIGYVYLVGLMLLFVLRVLTGFIVDLLGWSNAFGLRHAIARERGVAAYRAWTPLERIRPAAIPQDQWEETYAWPAGNKPPYAPLWQRALRGLLSYVLVLLAAAIVVQLFTPFPVLTWIGKLWHVLIGGAA